MAKSMQQLMQAFSDGFTALDRAKKDEEKVIPDGEMYQKVLCIYGAYVFGLVFNYWGRFLKRKG